jgi:polyhydroxybutyrate depolymerase
MKAFVGLGVVFLFAVQAVSFQAMAAEGKPRGGDSAPGDHTRILKIGGLDRHYSVHVPPGYDGKRPMPVVVMLHGGGGTSPGAAKETLWDVKADQAGFLAVFPDATPPDTTKPGKFRGNPQTWNDGSGRFDAGQKGVDDIGFLNAMLDDLEHRFAVDRRRIFVTGFSNGASMTFRVGVELSHRVAAIAPVAGACWSDAPKLKGPVSLCYITGDADPLNPLEGGEPKFASSAKAIGGRKKPPVRDSIGKWTTALACPAKPAKEVDQGGVKTVTYGPGRDGAEVVFVTVEGLGHNWAGGKNLLPEFMVGKRSDKLKTTDFVWDFFKNHPAPK